MSESTPSAGPGHKPLPKKAKIGLAVGGAGLAGYLYYRNRQAAAAAAASATPADATVDGSSATDTAALGLSSDTGPGVYADTASAASSTTVGTVTTNQDWYNTALSAVEDVGYDGGTAAAALSAYLAHQPLTASQQAIVRIGLAAAGNPPVGTFTVITAPAVPVAAPSALKAPTDLKLRELGKTNMLVSWAGVSGSKGYNVYVNGHKSTRPVIGSLISITSTFAGTPIKAGTKYAIVVHAVSQAGTEGPASATLSVTTKK